MDNNAIKRIFAFSIAVIPTVSIAWILAISRTFGLKGAITGCSLSCPNGLLKGVHSSFFFFLELMRRLLPSCFMNLREAGNSRGRRNDC